MCPAFPETDTRPAPPDSTIVIGDLELDLDTSHVTLAGQPLPLRCREFELLAYLARRRGTYVSRADILRDVWGDPYAVMDNTLCVHLTALRRKLGERASQPRLLRSRRYVGIKLDVPTPAGAW